MLGLWNSTQSHKKKKEKKIKLQAYQLNSTTNSTSICIWKYFPCIQNQEKHSEYNSELKRLHQNQFQTWWIEFRYLFAGYRAVRIFSEFRFALGSAGNSDGRQRRHWKKREKEKRKRMGILHCVVCFAIQMSFSGNALSSFHLFRINLGEEETENPLRVSNFALPIFVAPPRLHSRPYPVSTIYIQVYPLMVSFYYFQKESIGRTSSLLPWLNHYMISIWA